MQNCRTRAKPGRHAKRLSSVHPLQSVVRRRSLARSPSLWLFFFFFCSSLFSSHVAAGFDDLLQRPLSSSFESLLEPPHPSQPHRAQLQPATPSFLSHSSFSLCIRPAYSSFVIT